LTHDRLDGPYLANRLIVPLWTAPAFLTRSTQNGNAMTALSTNGRPPRRFEHTWSGPSGTWAYDLWGEIGRPVVLLHGPMFDRTMWWPVAAELADDCIVVAVDLPGHGGSPSRSSYQPAELVADLARLIAGLDLRQAPIVVGHSVSALLACLFGGHIRVRATVAVAQSLDVRPLAGALSDSGDLRGLLPDARLDTIPPTYRDLATPDQDDQRLAAYLGWMADRTPQEVQRVVDDALHLDHSPHLSVFGDRPGPGYPEWLRRLVPSSRCVVYPHAGLFPHLQHVDRFAADLRELL
jgi:pimeloyl-ACP methyl ester carboxylesterase